MGIGSSALHSEGSGEPCTNHRRNNCAKFHINALWSPCTFCYGHQGVSWSCGNSGNGLARMQPRPKFYRASVGFTQSAYPATLHTPGADRRIIGRMESHPPEYHSEAYQKHATQMCCSDTSQRWEHRVLNSDKFRFSFCFHFHTSAVTLSFWPLCLFETIKHKLVLLLSELSDLCTKKGTFYLCKKCAKKGTESVTAKQIFETIFFCEQCILKM